MIPTRWIAALLLCLAGCATQPNGVRSANADPLETTASAEPSVSTLQIKLYFGDAAIVAERDCRATKSVIRTIAKTPRVADAALRLLFQGVTPDEKKLGLTSSFAGLTDSESKPVEPLLNYYKGITITNGVATVKFSNPALTYLNNTACIQATVKAPIEDTLLQFPSVKSIQYSIDGKIFDQWDA